MNYMRPNIVEARSKIVATLGPACNSVQAMVELVGHGVDIFRINAAHNTQADFERLLDDIREVRRITGFQVATLLDLSGPKIRLGQLPHDPLEVEPGMELTFIRGDQAHEPLQMCSNYPRLVDEVAVGNSIMLADGIIALQVTSKSPDSFTCKVLTSGTIRSRQGINLPGVTLSVSAMLPQDVQNAIWAANNEIDFLRLSFVRHPQDVLSLKNLISSLNSGLVIAKLKREALQHLGNRRSGGWHHGGAAIWASRSTSPKRPSLRSGLSVCRDKLKPVIVATQMLKACARIVVHAAKPATWPTPFWTAPSRGSSGEPPSNIRSDRGHHESHHGLHRTDVQESPQ